VSGPLVGGIEAGGTKFLCAVGTGPDDVRAEVLIPTTTPAVTLAAALAFFAAASARGPLAALGIASFGPLDLDRTSPTFGFITTTPKPGWADTDVAGTFGRALGVPIGFDTDVNGAALGEHRWGAGRGRDPLVYVTVGTGVGGGAIVDGRRLHGLAHPEMGHVRVPRVPGDSFPGICPYHGDCLDGIASGAAIAARCGAPAETVPPAHPVWSLEAEYLALGLVAIVAILSPRRIVLGGGVLGAPHLLPRVRGRLGALLAGYLRVPALREGLEAYVVAPALAPRSGVLGALALAQDALEGR
jgi:fructokinase